MSSANKKINGQELKFPVDWEYRIIVEADKLEAARAAIGQCLREHGVSAAVHEGLRSEGGRYRTLKAPVVLTGREMMNALSAAPGGGGRGEVPALKKRGTAGERRNFSKKIDLFAGSPLFGI